MYAITIALIVFACVAGGALIGSLLGAVLPSQHLSNEAKDTVKVGMGLIGTMTAILLGLLIASAKSFFDTQNTELTEMSAKVILLDRMLLPPQSTSLNPVPRLVAFVTLLSASMIRPDERRFGSPVRRDRWRLTSPPCTLTTRTRRF
jgi:hypothetical protein